MSENWILIFIAVFVGLFAGLCGVSWLADSAAEDRFVAECQQHEPHYRCVALWRAGESHASPVVVPVVVGR